MHKFLGPVLQKVHFAPQVRHLRYRFNVMCDFAFPFNDSHNIAGRVVNVTSVRGRCIFPTASAYCMTKYGAEAFSDALRLEMIKFGVKVIIVEPSNFGGATGMLQDTWVSLCVDVYTYNIKRSFVS